MSKINLTAVSYLNTKPFLFGLLSENWDNQLNISLDIPSDCAKKLINGEADIGLVPVAALLENPSLEIISDFCIGSCGPVRTVALFSDRPIQQIERIYLDFHSRTSVALTKLLLRSYWNLEPELIPAKKGFIDQIGGSTAALVIGDRTIPLEKKHPYIYDLSEVWHSWTSMPFVFAVWVSRKKLSETFLKNFNKALALGVGQIDRLIYLLPPIAQKDFDMEDYLKNKISYNLDEDKKEGLRLFLEKINPGQKIIYQTA